MKILMLAVISIIFSVAAQFALKAGMSSDAVRLANSQAYSLKAYVSILLNPYILGGFLLYGSGALVWLGVLAKWDVSKAYPLVGLGFVFTVLIGFVAGENVSLPRIFGVVCICVGVWFVARS
jgi:multidrug transporter EmrE-like cation transporter